MAIKKISEFVSGAPTSADKILFEQNEKGKSTTIGDAVNTCSLSYEEIMASTDLTGKVASAGALKHLQPITMYKTHRSNPRASYVEQTDCRITIPANSIYGLRVYRSYNYGSPKSIVITADPPSGDAHTYPLARGDNSGGLYSVAANLTGYNGIKGPLNLYVYSKDESSNDNGTNLTSLYAWYITL